MTRTRKRANGRQRCMIDEDAERIVYSICNVFSVGNEAGRAEQVKFISI